MKKIGKGWQYTVYDLNNGRVRKQSYPTIIQYLYILSDTLFAKWNIFVEAWKGMHRVRMMEKVSNEYIKTILPIFDAKLLGNPVFLDDGYEQDKVVILDNILKNCTIEVGKKIFDAYVRLIHTTWQYGFADSVFNFTTNNSWDEQSEVAQIDFGELVLNKADVEKDILNKRWLRNASYTFFPNGELKDYYFNLMEQEMTLEKLDKLWGMKLKNNQFRAIDAEIDYRGLKVG